MRIPLLNENGDVVNVIEMADGCQAVSKAVHHEMTTRELADYETRAKTWRVQLAERQTALDEAKQGHFMATGVEAALRAEATTGLKGEAAERALDAIVAAGNEVKAYSDNLAELESKPLPERPRLERAHRWIIPEGLRIGPEGGEIGDRWDGESYIRG